MNKTTHQSMTELQEPENNLTL